MRVKRIFIFVQPCDFDPTYASLRVRADIDGRVVHYERAHQPDDLTSRFDLLFDEAREVLRAALKEGA